jgi:transcriptional regulator of acetoin/glycerol metabolism
MTTAERPGHAFTHDEHCADPGATIDYAREHGHAAILRADGTVRTVISVPRADPPCPLCGEAVSPHAVAPTLTLDDTITRRIELALASTRGNVTYAARQLGVGRQSLQRMIRSRGIRWNR